MNKIERTSPMQFDRCAAIFKATGQRCTGIAILGKRTCARHGAFSSGPKTAEGRHRCAQARTIHGQETGSIRIERSLASARLAVLESVGFALGMMKGTRSRGRRPDRMGEVYPELQALFQKLVIDRAITSLGDNLHIIIPKPISCKVGCI